MKTKEPTLKQVQAVWCPTCDSNAVKKNLGWIRIIKIRLLTLCALTFLSLGLAQGQSPDDVHISPQKSHGSLEPSSAAIQTLPPRNPHDRPLHVDVDVVLVPVTVTDSRNRPVTALNKQNFTLFEEDKRQEIRYFSAEEAPLSIAILLDVSKSMSDKIDIERAAIVEFFNNANPDDEYFAITFSDRPRVLASSTRSIDELQWKLMAMEPGGPKAMLDVVYMKESTLRSVRFEHKAIVIISDGGDNASRYTLREIKSLVRNPMCRSTRLVFSTNFWLVLWKKNLERSG
jgi:Ca-activated chloride channel family protein